LNAASPAVYRHKHDATFDALKAVPVARISSRKEADAILVERLPQLSKAERNYFLSNLVVTEVSSPCSFQPTYLAMCSALISLNVQEGRLRWTINLDVLAHDQHHVQDFPVKELQRSKGFVCTLLLPLHKAHIIRYLDLRPFSDKVIFFGSKDSGRMEQVSLLQYPPYCNITLLSLSNNLTLLQDFIAQIPNYFTDYDMHLLPGGHFIHSEHPQRFQDQLASLLVSQSLQPMTSQ